jgi:hypothetical protein
MLGLSVPRSPRGFKHEVLLIIDNDYIFLRDTTCSETCCIYISRAMTNYEMECFIY